MKRPTDSILPHPRWETVQVIVAVVCVLSVGVLLAL